MVQQLQKQHQDGGGEGFHSGGEEVEHGAADGELAGLAEEAGVLILGGLALKKHHVEKVPQTENQALQLDS